MKMVTKIFYQIANFPAFLTATYVRLVDVRGKLNPVNKKPPFDVFSIAGRHMHQEYQS